MDNTPTLSNADDVVCVVDVSNEGAGGLCWFRQEGECHYYHRRLPEPMVGATDRDSCRAELRNLVAATRRWGEQWRGRNVLVRCDHPCVRRGRSESRRRMHEAVAQLSARHGFDYRLEWSVKRKDPLMAAADRLSRADGPRGREAARGRQAVEMAVGRWVRPVEAPAPDDNMYQLGNEPS